MIGGIKEGGIKISKLGGGIIRGGIKFYGWHKTVWHKIMKIDSAPPVIVKFSFSLMNTNTNILWCIMSSSLLFCLLVS